MPYDTKLVLVMGALSQLMAGDPDKERCGTTALPTLIGEGWEIVGSPTTAQDGKTYITIRRKRSASK